MHVPRALLLDGTDAIDLMIYIFEHPAICLTLECGSCYMLMIEVKNCRSRVVRSLNAEGALGIKLPAHSIAYLKSFLEGSPD